MPEVPECLNRRYKALDGLIQELNAMPSQESCEECCGDKSSNEPGVKLMCDFWNILKEDPQCDLSQAVKQRMDVSRTSSVIRQQRVTCYVAGRCEKRKETVNKIKNICSQGGSKTPDMRESILKCCQSHPKSTSNSKDVLPLSKVLCNLKEAASFDKRCNVRVSELLNTQKELKVQIIHLEQREKEGIKLLKQADCMWACMEDAYKKKVAESLERQKTLLKQLKEAEASNAKWRKNKKELESQTDNVNKCHKEIKEKMIQKSNDLKYMDGEIADFQKRIENNKRNLDGESKVIADKKQASDKKIAGITEKIKGLKKYLADETHHKNQKEKDGQKYLKEAREDLQKICRVLLEKKLENEDLVAEKEALENEINLLTQTCEQCQAKCDNKEKYLEEEIKKTNKEIGEFKVRCIQCHQFTDTLDSRRLCSDCPRCKEERECLNKEDHCDKDITLDCVCMGVKEKFLDNVFDNMYTVLERQSKSPAGKVVADAVMDCLKHSRNGKLNDSTRKVLQEFVLNTVKKNLNLTIVGGAVKTRCEMDADTYKQLMLCLKNIKQIKPLKEDKGTPAKKESCSRWGGTNECNCPGGAKACICMQRAPSPPNDPNPCPPVYDKEEEDKGQVIACPHKESTACGPDCALQAVPSLVGAEVASWRPDPCSESACPFSNNMRAAQCVLGPESLSSLPKSYACPAPILPDISDLMTCDCGHTSTKPCTCGIDTNQLNAEFPKDSVDAYRTLGDQESNKIHHGYNLNEKNAEHNILNSKFKQIDHNHNNSVCETVKTLPSGENMNDNRSDQKQTDFFEAEKGKKTVDEPDIIINKDIYSATHVKLLQDKLSGNFLIELSEEIIDLLDKKSAEDPNMITILKKTDSGRFTIGFNSSDNTEGYVCRILEKQTPSGSRLLEVKKDFLHLLIPNDLNNGIKVLEPKIKPTDDITETENQSDMQNNPITLKNINIQSTQVKAHNEMLLEMNQKYEQKKFIIVKLEKETGGYSEIEAPLTKTISGNIAVDINQLLLLNNVKLKHGEYDAFVTRCDLGIIILHTNQDGILPNAILRRIHSKCCFLVLSTRQAEENVKTATAPEKFYKIYIKTSNYAVDELPAVFKSTSSQSLLVVPYKEFEINYKQTVQDLLKENTKYSVNIIHTGSDRFVLNFEDPDYEPNALIVKNESGDIHLKKIEDSWTSDIELKKISIDITLKALNELLNKLPRKTKENINKSSLTQQIAAITEKSSSDSYLYEKVKAFSSDHKNLLAKLSPFLKQTRPGQYVVVLDKEPKKIFIKNLKTYLGNYCQGLTPIYKTDTGEITMALDSTEKDESHYGVLKITPSGNIYVDVDQKLVKEMIREPVHVDITTPSVSDKESKHIIRTNAHPANKAVTTTCNGEPEDCRLLKCACSNITFENLDWVIDPPHYDKQMFFRHPALKMKSSPEESYEILCNKYTEQCLNSNRSNNCKAKALPHIVIKPCDYQSVLSKNRHFNEQCFYVLEVVCPYQENVWSQSTNYDKKIEDESDWDSLNFLPPQLPDFLKGFQY